MTIQNKLKKESVIKALTTICCDYIASGKPLPDGHGSVESLVESMYSEELAEEIGMDWSSLYVCDAHYDRINFRGSDVCVGHLADKLDSIEDDMTDYEVYCQEEFQTFPKVWPKPAACIGSEYANGCCDSCSDIPEYEGWIRTYMDVDGEIFGVYEVTINDRGCSFIMRSLLKDDEFELNISEIVDMFPVKYRELFAA